jgi:UDP-glucose 4-epimerase
VSAVLVTGGAGFIGSHLVDALLARGDDVVVLDNLSTGSRDNVHADAELVEGDVAEGGAVRKAFALRSFDAVLHIAGQASIAKSFDEPERDLRVNVAGTLNVVGEAIASGVRRLLHASSMTAYGEPRTIPTPESEPCIPVSNYGVTKYASERYVHVAGARDDVDLAVTSLRMFNVYGERQSLTNPYQGVLAIFVGNVLRGEPIMIHSDGDQTRDFVYVGDVVDAWLRLLDNRAAADQVYNVGSGRETTIAELARAVVRACGHDEWEIATRPAQLGDLRRSCADVRELQSATGWQPATSLDDGMRRTVDWARAD